MARNTLRVDMSGFEDLITRLEGLNGDVKKAVEDSLEQAAETIEEDTKEAVGKAYLPAKGVYSRGDTADSIVQNARVKWSGTLAEIDVGFDYSKPGAGGFLIIGTPKMEPDYKLKKMYKGAAYRKFLREIMEDAITDCIDDIMGG